MSSKVILILGSGARIGANVSRAFAAKGYKVALAARSLTEADNTSSEIHIQADFSDPKSVISAFAKTKELLGTPSVVVYNGKFYLFSQVHVFPSGTNSYGVKIHIYIYMIKDPRKRRTRHLSDNQPTNAYAW